jgi:hypothetical protein
VNVDLVAVVAVAVAGRMVVEFDYIVDLGLGVDIVLHGLMYLVRIIVVVLVLDLDLGFRRLLIVSGFTACTRMKSNRLTARIIFLPLPTHTQSTHSSINPNSGRTNIRSLSPFIRRSITAHETRNLLSETSPRITSMLRLLPLSHQLIFKRLVLLLHLPTAIEHS